MLGSFIVVTGGDARYHPLIVELVASLRSLKPAADCPIGIIDAGLTAEQVAGLKAQGAAVVTPPWPVDIPARKLRNRIHLKANLAKLHLPTYFPGSDTLIWIDADAWVQDWEAVEMLRRGSGAEPLRHRRPVRPLLGDRAAARLAVRPLRAGALDPVQELQPRRPEHCGMPRAGDPADAECRRLCAEGRRAALGRVPALAEAGAAQGAAVHLRPVGDGRRDLSRRAAGGVAAGMVQLHRPLALRS